MLAPEIFDDQHMNAWLKARNLESLEQTKQGKAVAVEEFSQKMLAKFEALAAASKGV